MKRLFVIFILFVISFVFFTSCDLFHTNNTTRGNSYALIYGVADYIGSGNDLTYTYNDAFDMNEFFKKYNYDEIMYRSNNGATKIKMLEDFDHIRDIATDDDITVFFFAGHGIGYYRMNPLSPDLVSPNFITPIPDEYDGQASLIPYFTEGVSSEIFYASELLDELNTIHGKKLIILDICFAGGFVPENGVDVDGLPGDYDYTGDPLIFFQIWEKYLSDSAKTEYKDIWVIGSAGENELAYEGSSLQNGYFTYYLLQSLGYNHSDYTISNPIPADSNSDGLITVSEIYNEAFNRFQQNYNDTSRSDYTKYYSHTSGEPTDLILLDLSN